MFSAFSNNPVKYVDPDGEYTYDSHNKHRIIANLDDRNDLINAAELLSDPNFQYTITAYGETSGITKIFVNYEEIHNYLYTSQPVFNLIYTNQFKKGDGARVFFIDAQITNDSGNMNANANINFGVATVTIPVYRRNNFFVSLNLQGMSVSALLGMKGSMIGFDSDFSIVNSSLKFEYAGNTKNVELVLEGLIGFGASYLLGRNGFRVGQANGIGGSINMSVFDKE